MESEYAQPHVGWPGATKFAGRLLDFLDRIRQAIEQVPTEPVQAAVEGMPPVIENGRPCAVVRRRVAVWRRGGRRPRGGAAVLVWLGLALLAVGLPPAGSAVVGDIRTIAGIGRRDYSGDGGRAVSAGLDEPRAVAVDRAGAVYVVDTFNHRIRRIDPGGTITTLAGTGAPGFSGDGGPAEAAALHWPHAAALDAAETSLYIADPANHRIRKVDLATRAITTVAGTGEGGFAGDGGPATAARLNDPKGLAVDPGGNLYIADSANDRIRRVDPSGIITTIAGTGQTGFGGDGGPATAALFNSPRSLALDGAGNLYVADDNNDRVRRIDPAGVVTTYAGTGRTGFSGDGGPAAAADLARPRGVAVDGAGNVYVADCDNHRIRMVDTAGVISTVVGSGRRGDGGDGGPATEARLFLPRGVAVDGAGSVYVADTYNHRIRVAQAAG